MKSRNSPFLRWTLFPVLLALSFFSFLPGDTSALALSVEDEREAGEKFVSQVRSHFEFVQDEFVSEYINALGQFLLQTVDTKLFSFRFYVIKDGTLNAFAGPGGHVFLFSGLIDTMETADELAAVICHEVGHVSARHLAQRIEQNKKIGLMTMAGILAGVLVGGKAANAIITGASAAGIQAQLNYSREDERQADQLGFKYMDAAGFDPSGIITVLEKLDKSQWMGADRVPPYLLTHPGGAERISNTDIMMRDYRRKPEIAEIHRFREQFPVFKAILRAINLESHEAERLFRMDLDKDPDSSLAHFGLGIILKERSEYDSAIGHLKEALKASPDAWPILTHLGETYQLQGNDREAVSILERAVRKDDRNRTALFLLAFSRQNLKEYSEAVRIYERLTAMEPVRDEVYYNLGVAYGRQNRLAAAHYNFGIYFSRLKDPKKARFHFEKALDLSGRDPAMRDRIQKAMEELDSPPRKPPKGQES